MCTKDVFQAKKGEGEKEKQRLGILLYQGRVSYGEKKEGGKEKQTKVFPQS